jgi:cell division septation protein DedD
MEQKRTLWIIAAVGVFLLVVVGAALILYSPSLHRTPAAASKEKTEDWQAQTVPAAPVSVSPLNAAADGTTVPSPDGMTSLPPQQNKGTDMNTPAQNSAGGAAANQPIQSDNLTVISGNTNVYGTGTTTIDLNTLKSSGSSASAVTPQNQMAANAMNSTYSQQPAQPSYNYQEPANEESKAAAAKTTAAAAKTSSAKTTAAPAKKTTAAKTAPAAKIADCWWVQAVSYTAKKNADEARTTLESNKIPNEVFTWKDSKGKLFYRVRVGPYTTKSEAEYWQSRIKYIDQFAKVDSYVVNSSAKAAK